MDPFSNVYPTLLGCFGIILAGYLFGRLNLLSQTQSKGLELYIARIALPALLFKSLLDLDFEKVDWHFWFGILLSKVALFVIVVIITIVTSPSDVGRAGLFGIFVTQSNDLALGLPLFDAIYKESHPEYCQYLYLLIPVSVAFLNPIGFLMLEFHKSTFGDKSQGRLKIIWKAVKGVITNPLVFMVILGLIFNFIFHGRKQYIEFCYPFLNVIGNSFGSTALFYLGLNLVGSTKDYGGLTLVVPFLLVFCKSLIFPVLARQAVFWLCTNSSAGLNSTALSSFAFIYGTLPTAPPVAVYATMYNSHVDTIGTSMVLGTFISAPIMFVSSKMILMMKSGRSGLDEDFNKALFDTGILSTVCCVWVLVVMITMKFYRKVLHQCTLVLITFQFLLGLTTSLSNVFGHVSFVLALYLISLFGCTSWTALVSFTLTVVRCKGEAFALRRKFIFLLIGLCFPLAVGISLAATKAGIKSEWRFASNATSNPLIEYDQHNVIFNWLYGVSQIIVVIVCMISLIVLQRSDKYCRCRNTTSANNLAALIIEKEEKGRQKPESCCKRCKVLGKKQNDMEDVSFGGYSGQPVAKSIQGSHRSLKAKGFEAKGFETVPFLDDTDDSVTAYGAVSPAPVAAEDAQFDGLKDVEDLTLEEYFQGDSHQLTRHVILILFLCFFSILRTFLCFERLRRDLIAHDSGVYVEIEFLAVVCVAGQGFLSFAVFGFNKNFFNLLSFERLGCLQPSCFAKKLSHVPFEYLDQNIKAACQRFKAHHLEKCREDLVCNLRFHFKIYKNVFRGDQLVDWVIEYGLANTRMDAVYYGNCLLQGQIIQHCVKEHHFYDLPYFYRFCNEHPTASG